MAIIPDDPKQRQALIAIVVALGALYGFWDYWYSPKVEENTATRERVERLQESNRQVRLQAVQGEESLEERLAIYQRHVMQLEELIPASEEVPQLLRTVNSEARNLNVDVASYSPEPDVPGQYYTQRSYSIRAIGEYHDIGRFLTSIASLSRIITPVDVDLSPFSGSASGLFQYESPVVATFRIMTYVLPPGGAPDAQMGGTGA